MTMVFPLTYVVSLAVSVHRPSFEFSQVIPHTRCLRKAHSRTSSFIFRSINQASKGENNAVAQKMKGYIQTCLLALAAVALGQTGLGDLPDCAVREQTKPPFFLSFFFPPSLLHTTQKKNRRDSSYKITFSENLCIRPSKRMQFGRYQMLLR